MTSPSGLGGRTPFPDRGPKGSKVRFRLKPYPLYMDMSLLEEESPKRQSGKKGFRLLLELPTTPQPDRENLVLLET